MAVKTEEAKSFAHFTLHRQDLQFALDMLDLISKQPGECTRIQVGLWRSAVIHYAKCFGYSEVRGRLSAPEIFKDFPDAMPCHKYFLQLRHKHIAHDQNAYSQALPGAIINGPAEFYKVAKIVSTAFHVESLNPDDYKNLFNLVRRAIQYTAYGHMGVANRNFG